MDTSQEYDEIVKQCLDIFSKKLHDYGTAWKILRPSSITDQIYIKAKRIREIEEKGEQKIEEGVHSEYIGIINYGVMGLIQIAGMDDYSPENILNQYNKFVQNTKNLMLNKNHDYGEAWREMRISSLTDLILMKIERVKQIEDNKGVTKISEGIDANYMDMINYAVFALIRLQN